MVFPHRYLLFFLAINFFNIKGGVDALASGIYYTSYAGYPALANQMGWYNNPDACFTTFYRTCQVRGNPPNWNSDPRCINFYNACVLPYITTTTTTSTTTTTTTKPSTITDTTPIDSMCTAGSPNRTYYENVAITKGWIGNTTCCELYYDNTTSFTDESSACVVCNSAYLTHSSYIVNLNCCISYNENGTSTQYFQTNCINETATSTPTTATKATVISTLATNITSSPATPTNVTSASTGHSPTTATPISTNTTSTTTSALANSTAANTTITTTTNQTTTTIGNINSTAVTKESGIAPTKTSLSYLILDNTTSTTDNESTTTLITEKEVHTTIMPSTVEMTQFESTSSDTINNKSTGEKTESSPTSKETTEVTEMKTISGLSTTRGLTRGDRSSTESKTRTSSAATSEFLAHESTRHTSEKGKTTSGVHTTSRFSELTTDNGTAETDDGKTDNGTTEKIGTTETSNATSETLTANTESVGSSTHSKISFSSFANSSPHSSASHETMADKHMTTDAHHSSHTISTVNTPTANTAIPERTTTHSSSKNETTPMHTDIKETTTRVKNVTSSNMDHTTVTTTRNQTVAEPTTSKSTAGSTAKPTKKTTATTSETGRIEFKNRTTTMKTEPKTTMKTTPSISTKTATEQVTTAQEKTTAVQGSESASTKMETSTTSTPKQATTSKPQQTSTKLVKPPRKTESPEPKTSTFKNVRDMLSTLEALVSSAEPPTRRSTTKQASTTAKRTTSVENSQSAAPARTSMATEKASSTKEKTETAMGNTEKSTDLPITEMTTTNATTMTTSGTGNFINSDNTTKSTPSTPPISASKKVDFPEWTSSSEIPTEQATKSTAKKISTALINKLGTDEVLVSSTTQVGTSKISPKPTLAPIETKTSQTTFEHGQTTEKKVATTEAVTRQESETTETQSKPIYVSIPINGRWTLVTTAELELTHEFSSTAQTTPISRLIQASTLKVVGLSTSPRPYQPVTIPSLYPDSTQQSEESSQHQEETTTRYLRTKSADISSRTTYPTGSTRLHTLWTSSDPQCTQPCRTGWVEANDFCFYLLEAPNNTATDYNYYNQQCSNIGGYTLAWLSDLENNANYGLIQSMINNSTYKNPLVFIQPMPTKAYYTSRQISLVNVSVTQYINRVILSTLPSRQMNGTSGICRMQKYCAAPQCQTSVYFSTTAGQLLALTKQVDIVEWQQVIEAYCKSKPSETTQLHCSMKGYLTPDATMTACGALAETINSIVSIERVIKMTPPGFSMRESIAHVWNATMAFAITTGPVSSCSRCLSTGTASCTTVNSNTAYCICYTGWQGSTCWKSPEFCTDGTCLNGGTCQNNVDNYKCVCSAQFRGRNCETNINNASDPTVAAAFEPMTVQLYIDCITFGTFAIISLFNFIIAKEACIQRTYQAHFYTASAVAYLIFAVFRSPDRYPFKNMNSPYTARDFAFVSNGAMTYAMALCALNARNAMAVCGADWRNRWYTWRDKDWSHNTNYASMIGLAAMMGIVPTVTCFLIFWTGIPQVYSAIGTFMSFGDGFGLYCSVALAFVATLYTWYSGCATHTAYRYNMSEYHKVKRRLDVEADNIMFFEEDVHLVVKNISWGFILYIPLVHALSWFGTIIANDQYSTKWTWYSRNFLATTILFIESGNVNIETKRNKDPYIAFLMHPCVVVWIVIGIHWLDLILVLGQFLLTCPQTHRFLLIIAVCYLPENWAPKFCELTKEARNEIMFKYNKKRYFKEKQARDALKTPAEKEAPLELYPAPFVYDPDDPEYIPFAIRENLMRMYTIEYLKLRLQFKKWNYPPAEALDVNPSTTKIHSEKLTIFVDIPKNGKLQRIFNIPDRPYCQCTRSCGHITREKMREVLKNRPKKVVVPQERRYEQIRTIYHEKKGRTTRKRKGAGIEIPKHSYIWQNRDGKLECREIPYPMKCLCHIHARLFRDEEIRHEEYAMKAVFFIFAEDIKQRDNVDLRKKENVAMFKRHIQMLELIDRPLKMIRADLAMNDIQDFKGRAEYSVHTWIYYEEQMKTIWKLYDSMVEECLKDLEESPKNPDPQIEAWLFDPLRPNFIGPRPKHLAYAPYSGWRRYENMEYMRSMMDDLFQGAIIETENQQRLGDWFENEEPGVRDLSLLKFWEIMREWWKEPEQKLDLPNIFV